jgi:hypothetical protein
MRTPGLIVICALWLSAAGVGSWALLKYESTPTPADTAPPLWPARSHIAREGGHATLLMFVHPHCPCSGASMEELNRLLALCQSPVSTHVLFVRPKGVADDWTDTLLKKNAESIPGVKVAIDSEGEEARLFGAASSGCVILYDAQGKLLFSGGITASRGHAGDNAGESAVIDLVNGHSAPLKHTEVYGCTLLDHCELTTTNENAL